MVDEHYISILSENEPLFVEFSLCWSRACLGKMIVCSTKWRKRGVVLPGSRQTHQSPRRHGSGWTWKGPPMSPAPQAAPSACVLLLSPQQIPHNASACWERSLAEGGAYLKLDRYRVSRVDALFCHQAVDADHRDGVSLDDSRADYQGVGDRGCQHARRHPSWVALAS
jgi:hypothetical protein